MVLPERYSLTTPAKRPEHVPYSPSPRLLLGIRAIFTILTCLMALATGIMTAIVIHYYMAHRPMIFPPMSSMIFVLLMGFLTSVIYFGYFIFLPSLSSIRRGGLLWLMFTMKIEILFLFSMSAIWISGALAYAADYRGHENCIWNGYYHWPQPRDWNHLCDMVNWIVGMAYATFGIQVGFLAFDSLVATYMFLFVDQDSLSEPFYEWGTRAWEYRHQPDAALASTNQPMQYRSGGLGGAMGASAYGRPSRAASEYKEKDPYDCVSSSSHTYHDDYSYTDGDSNSSATRKGRPPRRGAAYSDRSYSDSVSDDSTLASSSNHYGGAYSRHTVNSRRAGLPEAPSVAGAGGTNAGVPSWTAPSITTDGGSMRSPPMSLRNPPRQVRHASMPLALGSRGRRGTSYTTNDNDTSILEEDFQSVDDADLSASRQDASKSRSRRRVSMDEESGWHLREP